MREPLNRILHEFELHILGMNAVNTQGYWLLMLAPRMTGTVRATGDVELDVVWCTKPKLQEICKI